MGVNLTALRTVNTVRMLEVSAHTFTVAEFGFSDPDDTPSNGFLSVKITTTPGLGSLTNNGLPVGQSVSVTDIAANRLVFTPLNDGNGAPYTSFTFQVRDD